jgi:hypothetical protein
MEMRRAQSFRAPGCSLVSAHSQPAMPQAQTVAQVQTGWQLQLQFWQVQEALDLVFFVFIDDMVHPR